MILSLLLHLLWLQALDSAEAPCQWQDRKPSSLTRQPAQMAQSETAISLLPRALLEQLNADLDALEADVVPTWEGLVDPLELVSDRLGRSWGAVGHLKVSQVETIYLLLLCSRRKNFNNAGGPPRPPDHLEASAMLL